MASEEHVLNSLFICDENISERRTDHFVWHPRINSKLYWLCVTYKIRLLLYMKIIITDEPTLLLYNIYEFSFLQLFPLKWNNNCQQNEISGNGKLQCKAV